MNLILARLIRQNLQRQVVVELGTGGITGLSDAALADKGGDCVVAESGADFESHGVFGLSPRSFYAYAGSRSVQN